MGWITRSGGGGGGSSGTTYIKGDANTDGSLRIMDVGGKLVEQKRVAGVWTTLRETDESGTTIATGAVLGSVTVDDASKRFGIVKQDGSLPEIRYINGNPIRIRRVTSGSLLAPTGSVVEAELGAAGGLLVKFLGARVSKSAQQSIAGGTDTAVTWNTEIYDTNGYHDNSTNNTRLTAVTAGYYRVGARIEWAPNTTNRRAVGYRINGGAFIIMNKIVAVDNGNFQSFCDELFLNANDYIEIIVNQDSGGALAVESSSFAAFSFVGM